MRSERTAKWDRLLEIEAIARRPTELPLPSPVRLLRREQPTSSRRRILMRLRMCSPPRPAEGRQLHGYAVVVVDAVVWSAVSERMPALLTFVDDPLDEIG